ncbi:MAG: alpha/beta fold hydrolase, partial [Acidimicrobiia bacterium]
TYTIAQMADDARAALDAAGVERSDILAYSMGSYAAQALAADHPERVGSMVLAGTACRHHDWRRDLLTGWARLATERGMHVMARAAFPWLLGPRTARRHGLWINALWPLVLSQPAPAFCAQVEALLATDDSDEARSRLSEITAPTLVLAGEQDHLMPPSDGAETAALIPGAAFTVVPGAGHGLMLEAPADFNGAVLNFLAAQTVGTAPT